MDESPVSDPQPPVYLVSACLLGAPTRFDGGACPVPALVSVAAQGRAVPICPEMAGGLPVPRPPAEIQGGDGTDVFDGTARVVTADGVDATAAFVAGAQQALAAARQHGIAVAVLKAHSPSCGGRLIHDGTFSGTLVVGVGVTAALLRRGGLTVLSEEDLERMADL